MVIFFVVIWKHVWRIVVYKVKEKKTRGGIHEKTFRDLGSGFVVISIIRTSLNVF